MMIGKTMENVRVRLKVKIVNGLETKTLEKLIAKPYFRCSYIFKGSEPASVKMGHVDVEKAHIPRAGHPRHFQDAHVRVLLQI